MRRASSSDNVAKKHYMQPTASSMAQRHPRAAKLKLDGRRTSFSGCHWDKELPRLRGKHRSTRSEIPIPSYSKGAKNSSCVKPKDSKNLKKDATAVKKDVRRELENRPELKRCQSKSQFSANQRASSAMSEVCSIGDSALGDVSGMKHSSRKKLHVLSETPPQSRTVETSPPPSPKTENHEAPNAASLVLTILYRMNRPKLEVENVFDLVSALNKGNQKRKSEDAMYMSRRSVGERRRIALAPSVRNLFSSCQDLSFAGVLSFVQRRPFLVAFPVIAFQFALQFPSILLPVLSVTPECWRQAGFLARLCVSNSIAGCLFPIRPALPY